MKHDQAIEMQKRIRTLIERRAEAFRRELDAHVAALARAIVEEFTDLTESVDLLQGTAPSYDPRTKHWSCPCCGEFRHVQRRAVSAHMRACQFKPTSEPKPSGTQKCPHCGKTFKSAAGLAGHLPWCGKKAKVCIAPGCRRHSKGPRFRFLCEKHLKATKKQVEKWRKQRAAEQR